MGITDKTWMLYALELAHKALRANEVPVGAILVTNEGKIIGQGWNQVIALHDPSAHAEIIALREAGQSLQNYRLPKNVTLYVTLEPCIMCAGALIEARLSRVVFAARDFQKGALGSLYNVFSKHRIVVDESLLADECSKLLLDFFKKRRMKK